MKKLPDPSFARSAMAHSAWDFGNEALYTLCASNPTHQRDDIIIAKVWLIGRSYSAAIERRQSNTQVPIVDQFYETVVAPTIRASQIDSWLASLTQDDTIQKTIEIHKQVMDLFADISEMDQRSLASKYLHFHHPERFFIYDSRAQKAVSNLTKPIQRRMPAFTLFDNIYARFCLRCQRLTEALAASLGRTITPRELDKVLLEVERNLTGQ